MNLKNVVIILCSLFFVHCSLFSQTPPPTPMSAFEELTLQMHKIDSILNLKWDKTEYCNTVYSAELFSASSNEGSSLLNGDALNIVSNSLDAFQEINVKAVSITINYPILVNGFSENLNYLAFYKSVVGEIRKRNMKLLINCNISYSDTTLCKLNVKDFYTDITTERYRSEKLQMLSTIIDELQPDYLTIEQEPTAFVYSTGIDLTVNDYAENVNYFLGNTDKKQTLLGAGTGSWEDIKYTESISQNQLLDYIDIHIFPVYADNMTFDILSIDSVAKANGKKSIIGSSWVYKTNELEFVTNQMIPSPLFISRNCFNTYLSIDSAFIKNIYKISNIIKSDFTSFNWAQSFFGYIKYNKTIYEKMLPYKILNIAKDTITHDVQQLNVSSNGEVYQHIIKSLCDPDNINNTDNLNTRLELNVYPNPTKDHLNIEFNNTDFNTNKGMSISIFDIQGRSKLQLHETNLIKGINKFIIETNSLNNGLYILQFQNSTNIIYKKFIINN